jgi:protein-S-isoprenylcysteine O-methyltransferase Ste14
LAHSTSNIDESPSLSSSFVHVHVLAPGIAIACCIDASHYHPKEAWTAKSKSPKAKGAMMITTIIFDVDE